MAGDNYTSLQEGFKNRTFPFHCLSGYCCLHGIQSDFGVILTGSQFLMRPTLYLSFAHSVSGRSESKQETSEGLDNIA